MRQTIRYIIFPSMLCLFPFPAKGQSTIEFQSGTQIEVTTGADICADNVVINGTYSGGGTKCGDPLPVELVSFTVTSHRSDVELNWRTATEVDNHGFEVERNALTPLYPPTRGVLWEKIGFVEGSGTTNIPKQYSFIDKDMNAGKYSYRLKQIDRDGGFSYSDEAEIIIGSVSRVFTLEQNYPNPFNPATTIGFTLQVSGLTALKVYDAIGREVAELVNENLEAGVYHEKTFTASKLASGIYFAKLTSDGKSQVKKLMLMK